jgi:four helix bundle protein
MALYNFLPVYKVSHDLLLEIFLVSKNFSREYKYTVGEQLKNEIIALMLNIYRANSRRDKKETIEKARENIETIRILARVIKDLKQVGVEKFISINEKIESISKQLVRWRDSAR